jgi:glutaminyl-tRNA synthetase
VEELEAVNNPEDPTAGSRKVPFSRELFIEAADFCEEPPPKYYRLAPGRDVRLRYGYLIKCVGVVKDPATGQVTAVRCTYDPQTRGGQAPDGRKVRGTIHWVEAARSVPARVRLYDHLFTAADPEDVDTWEDFLAGLNPDSEQVLTGCRVEPALAGAAAGTRMQFERQGYFCVDADSSADDLVFNRTVSLRDSWAKIVQRQQQGAAGS